MNNFEIIKRYDIDAMAALLAHVAIGSFTCTDKKELPTLNEWKRFLQGRELFLPFKNE